jgi:hypothetical protein
MSAGEDKPTGLALASSAGLTLAGVRSLAARGCCDLRNKEEAEEWLRYGLKLQEEANTGAISPEPTSWTSDWRRIVEYGKQIQAGNHPELVAKSLGMTPEDEEKARTMYYFVPSVVASIAQRMQQEEEQQEADLKKYEDTMREAFQCFEKGIRLDPYHLELLFQLGMAYQLGLGVQEDLARGFNWLSRAAEQGHADAQYQLCGFHDEEFCLPRQNNVQAAAWCRKAAEQGHNMAQFHMCNLYLLGDGVPRDKVEACFWHELFISNWDEKAAMKSRSEFPARLSSEQLAHVQQRVAKWISAHGKHDSAL